MSCNNLGPSLKGLLFITVGSLIILSSTGIIQFNNWRMLMMVFFGFYLITQGISLLNQK